MRSHILPEGNESEVVLEEAAAVEDGGRVDKVPLEPHLEPTDEGSLRIRQLEGVECQLQTSTTRASWVSSSFELLFAEIKCKAVTI